jgi:pectate lyase
LISGYTAVTAGNLFTNTTENTDGGSTTAFLPPYSIVTLKASAVAADISTNAGATATGNTYGSF